MFIGAKYQLLSTLYRHKPPSHTRRGGRACTEVYARGRLEEFHAAITLLLRQRDQERRKEEVYITFEFSG